MDTNKYTISHASFVTKIFCSIVSYVKRKKAHKLIWLISVVLFCIFTRYVVLSYDKITVKQVRVRPVNFKLSRFPSTSAAINIKSELAEIKQSYQHRIKPLYIRKEKNSGLHVYTISQNEAK
jgi:hypothetical protein